MIYFILLSLWPILNFLTLNIGKIHSYYDLSMVAIFCIVFGLLNGAIIKKYTKYKTDCFLLPLLITVLMFFCYGPFVEELNFLQYSYIKASYVWLISYIALFIISLKISKNLEIQKIAKVVIVVTVGISFVEAIYLNTKDKKELHVSPSSNEFNFIFQHKPNVYYLLVDAYGRQDTLKEVCNLDNEPFLQELEQKGFVVSRKALSNYHFTIASLSATMDMKYHIVGNGDLNSQMCKSLSGENSVRKVFTKNGYKIINIPAYFHETQSYKFEDANLGKSEKEILEALCSTTPLRAFNLFKRDYVDMEEIKEAIQLFQNDSKFIFAHFMQVHDAIFDESGKIQPMTHPCFSGAEDGKRYIFSVKTMNLKIIEFVEEIRKKDPGSVIIIQADHGPTYVGNLTPADPTYWLKRFDSMRLAGKQDFRYTFGIFTAIYLPEYDNARYTEIKEYFSGEFTLVNTFRYIFAYLSEKKPDLVPDKSHFLYYDQASRDYKEDNIDHLTN